MQLTEKQLKIQERADKTLSFGCIVQPNFSIRKVKIAKILAHFWGWNYRVIERIDTSTNAEEFEKDFWHCEFSDYENWSFYIIWHLMTYSRLLYFMTIYKDCDLLTDHIVEYVLKNPNVLNETVLERPEYLLDRVIDFLDTLPKE